MTLGPNKGTYRPGRGLRWIKVRRPRADARAPATVCYLIWRSDDLGTCLCARTFTVRDDLGRPTAARLVREARSYVLGKREAQRAASARRQASEARAAARRALG